jgi:hypothetical protein
VHNCRNKPAVKGYSQEDVKKWCDVKNIAFSEWIWKKTNGLRKNRNWTPIFRDWGVAQGGCCDKSPQFPGQFQTIADMAKADRWREWKYGVITGSRPCLYPEQFYESNDPKSEKSNP